MLSPLRTFCKYVIIIKRIKEHCRALPYSNFIKKYLFILSGLHSDAVYQTQLCITCMNLNKQPNKNRLYELTLVLPILARIMLIDWLGFYDNQTHGMQN
jgi:hypothetical protein